MAKQRTDGDNIIYHYIQKTLLSDGEPDASTRPLIERLLVDLSIWFPPEVYRQIPILLPYTVRDASCRKKGNDGSEEWGTANERGFFRDDNSLVKAVVKSFVISGNTIKEYDKKKLGNGFVAAHIWRKLNSAYGEDWASTIAQTNSFVPNLVWLPRQISKLTDREGRFAQKLLQSLSRQIYAGHSSSEFKQRIWAMLPETDVQPERPIDLARLNYFDVPTKWIESRKQRLIDEMERIRSCVETGEISAKKVKCSAYLPSLSEKLAPEHTSTLLEWLDANIRELSTNQ